MKVNGIYKTSDVSRATLYRLFDSIYDVLLYQCVPFVPPSFWGKNGQIQLNTGILENGFTIE